MNPYQKAIALCALLGASPHLKADDITLNVDAGAGWIGWMNFFASPEEGAGFISGEVWGTADLRAVFTDSVLTLSPNTINPEGGLDNPIWYKEDGSGNRTMEANFYVQVSGSPTTAGALSGHSVTFTGTVSSNTLTEAHGAVAFIKDFAPDFSSSTIETVPLGENGTFTVTMNTDPGVGRHVQYGFQTTGVNVWPEDPELANFGKVEIAAIPSVPANPNVTVDPEATWLGYLNYSYLPDEGGGYVGGGVEPVTSELRASFSGNVLSLSPYINTEVALDDTDWYRDDGIGNLSGNRQMEANFYVQPANGSLSGQTVTFSGTVLATSLTEAHTTIAFIKEFNPNYTVFNETTVELVPGQFSISLPISSDPSRPVQYGLQMVGPNIRPEDAEAFGSIQIDDGSVVTTTFGTWIASFDFSGFTDPDLTPTGDPDGDGQSNFQEFALNSDPTSNIASGKMRVRVEDVDGDQALVMTLPVRGTPSPEFSGDLSKTATADEVVYIIEGTNDLSAFNEAVIEVSPARAGGLPANGTGWSYRSFRLDGTVEGEFSRGPRGFLRARILEEPAP